MYLLYFLYSFPERGIVLLFYSVVVPLLFSPLLTLLLQLRVSGANMAFCARALSRASSSLLFISKSVSRSAASTRAQHDLKVIAQPQQVRHKSYITPPEGSLSTFT